MSGFSTQSLGDPDDYFKTSIQRELEREQAETEETQQQAIVLAYKRLFSDADGKLVLQNLSKECSEHDELFCPDSRGTTDYLLGRRSVILHIRNMIRKDIDAT